MRTPCSPTTPRLALLAVLALGAVALAQDARPIDATREALQRWVETQRILSQEERDWQLAREVLAERIELTRREVASLRARTGEARQSLTEADHARAELLAKEAELRAGATELADAVAGLEARTRTLAQRFPDPLQRRVEPLLQRIPLEAESPLPLSQRFQNVVGVLNEAQRFQGDVTFASELRELADGRLAEAATLYLGLAQAFYATADGSAAGIGRPGPSGFEWSAAPDAKAIAELVAVYRQTRLASFVRVPVEVQ